jgi:phosphoesterase RecJ-like protein
MSATLDLSPVVDALECAQRVLVVTHEHPDGDAIGSIAAMHRILASAGGEATMLIPEGDEPASEYQFLFEWDDCVRTVPEDLTGWTVAMLDCGNMERSPLREVDLSGVTVLNIDHHHDNTRFGTIDLIDPAASCTAELVWRLAAQMGAELTLRVAEALYVGLVTDTGRFMYSNTGTAAHMMACDLIDAGVDVELLFRRIYEGVPEGQTALLARALSSIERYDSGRLTLTWLDRTDYEVTEAMDGWSEGVIDHLRAIAGTFVAAVIREPSDQPEIKRVSLRASHRGVDVSAIARAGGGGGHPGAAGFRSSMQRDELVEFLRNELASQMEDSSTGS